LFVGVSAVSPTKPLLAQRQVKTLGSPSDDNPADSDTIEGPDCGHVSKIIGKWGHAKKVGVYAGAARAAVMNADNAARNTDNAVEAAEKVGEAVSEDGKVPSSISGAAGDAKDASSDVTDKSANLDTKLTTFKDKAGNSEFSGENVKKQDLADIKKLTVELNEASTTADEAAKRVTEKAAQAKKDALKNSGAALKLMKAVIEEGEPMVKAAKKIEQKVGWAKEKADKRIEAADALVPDIKNKGKESDEQEPVYVALAEGVEAKASSLTDSKESLNTAIGDLEKAITAAEDAIGPLKEAADKGDGGDTVSVTNEAENIAPGEEAVGDLDAAISKVKARAKTMMERMERLDDAIENAEEKIA